MQRVMFISDMHCGHMVGLTPPEWQGIEVGEHIQDKFVRIRKQLWDWFEREVELVKPVDRLVINGDAIGGKGERSGGTEMLTLDRVIQGDMVVKIIELIDPPEVAMTFGTPYHTGTNEDMEKIIRDKINLTRPCTIESHLERTIEGVRIDARHFISNSTIPHGRYTALAREDLWRLIWADRSDKEPPHLVIRSHVHYYAFQGNEYATGIITPCLQGLGDKFGSRVCSGTVSIGFIIIDCDDGAYTWEAKILPLKEQVSEWKSW